MWSSSQRATSGGIATVPAAHWPIVLLGRARRRASERWVQSSAARQAERRAGVISVYVPELTIVCLAWCSVNHASKRIKSVADIESPLNSEIANNNSAAPPDGWPEGQAPSSANNCAREMIGALKREWNRSHPTVTSGGSA